MNISIGTKLQGFTVQRIRRVDELQGSFVEMLHDKTGAQLCWMDNQVQNKLFCVAFETLPQDSTGVFHILEHSVFCGSEKYPVKEPFVDLMKSSMNTFLNAMTYSDKTVYPVSSCNRQDFLNLMAVYLDAVFAPALLQNPNVFYQEGIHTEIEGGDCYYKGVVFNEMKGEMSGADARIEEEMERLLFPDTCYRFNSGGDPREIPDLTYEQYVQTYRRFYHPSNARFFLDGDIPLEETLGLIDAYLARYERVDMQLEIPLQTPVSAQGTQHYEISDEEDGRGRAILTLGKIIGTWAEREKLLATQILCDVLADSNESPLKRAVLSSGLAEDFEMAVTDGIQQPYLLLVARNMDEADGDAIQTLIRETVDSLLRKGLDTRSISASINRFAFRARQVSEPQGLYRALESYKSWLYGGDPLQYLLYDEAITALREMAETGGFERLLRELLAGESGMAVLYTLPSVSLGAEERRAEESRVRREAAALTEQQRDALLRQNEALHIWQAAPDSPEAVATIPKLSLGEVSETPQCTETVEQDHNGTTVLYHPVPSHGIVYLSMYFPLTAFKLEELTALSLFPELFGELPTERYGIAELQRQIKTYIGSLSFGLAAFGRREEKQRCTPCLEVRAGILQENFAVAKALIAELLTKTQFDHPDKIREIVMQAQEESRQMAAENGHSLGVTAVQSHYSARDAVGEAIGGYSFLRFLRSFAGDFDRHIGAFLALIQRAVSGAIQRQGMILSVTASEEAPIDDLIAALPQGTAALREAAYTSPLPMRMGIRIPSQVSFAVKGYDLACCGRHMSGSLRVAASILSLSYLWSEIRVQGGAYGAGCTARRDGGIYCYSYRDPDPARTLLAYDTMAQFLQKFCQSGEEELEKFIISAVAATDALRTPREMGAMADEFWFSGITDADRQKMRREMLCTDRKTVAEWCGMLERMAQDAAVCVAGNGEALEKCGGLVAYEL